MVSGVIRCGELESEVRSPRIRMVPRQPIRSDFSGIGFPGFFRHAEIESEVRSPRIRVVATQPVHPRFIEKGFSEVFETWELEFVFRLSGSSLVDRQAIKIEFAGNMLFWCISTWETRIRGPNTSITHWSTGNQWKSGRPETRFPNVSRCGKHESGAEKSRNPLVHPQPMEFELAEKFLSILDWKKNWSHVFTSHIGRGLERVDTGITRTSREWRPEGSPTNG